MVMITVAVNITVITATVVASQTTIVKSSAVVMEVGSTFAM